MSDRIQVHCALIADQVAPFERVAPEAEWNRPYAERQKVVLDIDPAESLAHVLERAAAAMGFAPPADERWRFRGAHAKVAFYRPEDEHGFHPRPLPRFLLGQLTLVDDYGHAIFGVHDFRAVRYRDLLRASEAGTLDGDPRRPYLIIEAPYGDWIGPDWPTLLEGLEVAWRVVEHVATAGGALAAGKFAVDQIRKRLRRGIDAIEANPQWAQRGSMPYQVIALASQREWRADELAPLLGCATDEAEGVLSALGFAPDSDRHVWRYEGDPTADVMALIFREIMRVAHEHGEAVDPQLTQRLSVYFAQGELPHDADVHEWDDGDFDDRPTAGERIGDVVDGAIEFARDIRSAWKRRRPRR